MIAVPVDRVRRVVCASPALLHTGGIPQHPRELSHRPCVLFRGIAPGDSWSFRERAREFSIRVSGSLVCNQAAAAAQACTAGLGFGLFLSYQIGPLVRAGKLEVVLPDFEPPPLPVTLVYTDDR